MLQEVTRSIQKESPERWASALDRALHIGIEIYTTTSGQRYATSSTHHDVIYLVTETECECPAGKAGDPICLHRAALRSILGSLPVINLGLDELIPADAPKCHVCGGKGERWAGVVDDQHNPQRWIVCPDCCGTGHDLAVILRAA